MDDREILEELRELAPRKSPPVLKERILGAGRARAARIRARRRGRLLAAAAVLLLLGAIAWGPGGRENGPEPTRALAVAARSALLETEARKALLAARISRLERLASSLPGKSAHLKALEKLRRELDRLALPPSLPGKRKAEAEKKDTKKSWIPNENGGLRHV